MDNKINFNINKANKYKQFSNIKKEKLDKENKINIQDKVEINSLDNILDNENFKNISDKEAAKMLGYFTQKLQNQGFPWKVKIKSTFGYKTISELEALRRLKKGEVIFLEPKRIMKMNVASDAGNISNIGNQIGKPVDANKVKNLGSALNVQEGFEVNYGKPVPIKNYAELKLFYLMNNPDVQINEKDDISQLAHKFAFFTSKKLSSNYPFKFYKPNPGILSRIKSGLKSGITAGLGSAVLGGFMGALAGIMLGPLGVAIPVTKFVVDAALGIGALVGVKQFSEGIKKGEAIDDFEAFQRVENNQPIIVQEKKKHSFNLPIIGNISWYTNYSEGSKINNKEEFNLFYDMQNQ